MLLRKLAYIAGLIITIILGSIICYSIIESLPLIDALNMTIITMSTV